VIVVQIKTPFNIVLDRKILTLSLISLVFSYFLIRLIFYSFFPAYTKLHCYDHISPFDWGEFFGLYLSLISLVVSVIIYHLKSSSRELLPVMFILVFVFLICFTLTYLSDFSGILIKLGLRQNIVLPEEGCSPLVAL
jgi:H+/Cl- antiporter ClcA